MIMNINLRKIVNYFLLKEDINVGGIDKIALAIDDLNKLIDYRHPKSKTPLALRKYIIQFRDYLSNTSYEKATKKPDLFTYKDKEKFKIINKLKGEIKNYLDAVYDLHVYGKDIIPDVDKPEDEPEEDEKEDGIEIDSVVNLDAYADSIEKNNEKEANNKDTKLKSEGYGEALIINNYVRQRASALKQILTILANLDPKNPHKEKISFDTNKRRLKRKISTEL